MIKGTATTLRICLLLCGLTAALHAQRPEIIYLQFNETTGTSAADLAAPGTMIAASLGATGSFDTSNPQLGGACLMCSGAAGDPCTTNVPFVVTGDWTISLWILDTEGNLGNTRDVFGDQTAGNLRCFKSGNLPNNGLQLEGAGMNPVFANNAFQTGTWKHVAFVHDSVARTIRPYVNGVAGTSVEQPTAIPLNGTGVNGLTIGGYNGGNSWMGSIDEFRVWDRALTNTEISAMRTTERTSPTMDMAISSIVSPAYIGSGCDVLTTTETVRIQVHNTGSMPIPSGTTFTASVRRNATNLATDMVSLSTTLNTGESEIVTLPTTIDLSAGGTFAFFGDITFTGDTVSTNNSSLRVFIGGAPAPIASFPYVENFDGSASNLTNVPPAGWFQVQTDSTGTNSDWLFSNTATPTAGTGPASDFTSGTGYYAFVEDDGDHGAVSLRTACFDFTAASSPRLKFWAWSENPMGLAATDENFLSVDVLDTTNGTLTTDVFGPSGHTGALWQPHVVSLAAWAGTNVRLIFRGTSNGGSNMHDIAIDDVTLFDFVPGIGQVPQPGLAVMDINNAESPGLNVVSSLDAGPYTANVTPGDLLDFDFDGEPNQTIILLLGPKNASAASFTGIGKIDIGGPINMATGIPTGITVFADGSIPSGFNPFFNTTPSGHCDVFFTMPPFPPGVLTTFQAVMLNSQPSGLGMTNAIEVVVN